MHTIHISQLTGRYRLPPSRADKAGRLDRVLGLAVQEGLEPALARLGLDLGGEVCVREVRVPVRLRLSRGDRDLAVDWGLALAAGVRDAVAAGRDDVAVRYGSRRQALVDFAASAARGDLGRAWAWRQLGLAQVADHASRTEAAQALTAALEAEPEAIVSVVAAVARLGHLPALLATLGPDAVVGLARAAAGPGSALLAEAGDEGVEAPEGSRSLDRSEILAGGAEAVRGWPLAARQAVALLGLLEVEPTAPGARGEHTPFVVAESADPEASTIGMSDALGEAAAAYPLAPQRGERAGVRGRGSPQDDPSPSPSPLEGRGKEDDGLGLPTGSGGAKGGVRGDVSRDDSRAALSGESPDAAPDPTPLPDLRTQGDTDWGGLLFLLGLLEDLGFPEQALAAGAVAGRPFRWVTHALALTLAPAAADDPAALAFAGLAPDRAPPSEGEAPPHEAEKQFLAEWRDRIVDTLEERLPDAEPRGPALLRWVCRRPATVVADPGWLEIRLPLGQVSTHIRRAGLDLDPGWLPWLGVVVVVRYG